MSEAEAFAVTVGGRSIAVRVRRHHAARRYRLRYDAVGGELRLTLPPRQPIAPARAWVAGQGAWIESQIVARPTAMPVGTGSQLPWQGGALTISWQAGAPRTPRLAGNLLIVGGLQDGIGRRVARWMQARARTEFTERTQAMARAEQLPLMKVSIGDPRSRWGSCSARGAIRYNWRLIMAPDAVRHAIVAHEVAHLAHMNHGPAFHALADRLGGAANVPSRQWLRDHGASLHALRFDG